MDEEMVVDQLLRHPVKAANTNIVPLVELPLQLRDKRLGYLPDHLWGYLSRDLSGQPAYEPLPLSIVAQDVDILNPMKGQIRVEAILHP